MSTGLKRDLRPWEKRAGLIALSIIVVTVLVLGMVCPLLVYYPTVSSCAHAWRVRFLQSDKRLTVFCQKLELVVPSHWECNDDMAKYWTLSGRNRSIILFGQGPTATLSVNPAYVQWSEIENVAIGGEPASMRWGEVKVKGIKGYYVRIVVPSRELQLDFLGAKEDWTKWQDSLRSAKWKDNK